MTPRKLAVLISGRGSNMMALEQACADPDFPAEIVLVLSNKAEATGLTYAHDHGLQTAVVNHKDYDSREAFEDALLAVITNSGADLICLAGFMRILTPHFLNKWSHEQGRDIINIHPSLLPDYKGLNTHERVLADGGLESGCTVHHVIPEMDAGPVIVQRRVSVQSDDTPDTLAARVLEQEHIAYPEAVRKLALKPSNTY